MGVGRGSAANVESMREGGISGKDEKRKGENRKIKKKKREMMGRRRQKNGETKVEGGEKEEKREKFKKRER